MTAPRIVLASGSRYRRAQIAQLGLAVDAIAPDIDESDLPGESPAAAAARLAQAKAAHIAAHHPDALVIGSDQVADLHGQRLGKPGTASRAIAQLRACSGQTVQFHTALCVLAPGHAPMQHLDRTDVAFRTLQDDEIARYVAREQPLDCAGSFKVEGLGICLFEHVRSEDPSALIGLPLIALARILRTAGTALP